MVSSGQLKLLNVKPGIDKNDTIYQAEGAYVSAQWVRFKHGNAQKIGGWINFTTSSAYGGIARDAITWSDLSANPLYAVGTNEGLWVSNGQLFYDITPVSQIIPVVSVFSTVLGSPIVGVSINSPLPEVGQRFYVDPQVSVDGLSIGSTDHQITYTVTSVGSNGFDFVDSNATSTVVNAGVSTNMYFLLPPGPVSDGSTGGWGSGPWGGTGSTNRWNDMDYWNDNAYWNDTGTSGTVGWGVGVSGGLSMQMRQWSLATWGQDLLANPRDGGIYVWQRSLGFTERATLVSTAPSRVNSIEVLSPPRILVAYGTSGFASDFDPMLVRWSDQENYSIWTPAVTNASGELRLQFGNIIQNAIPTKNETLIFTDTAAYTQNYIGGDFVYSITQVGNACGLLGMHAATEINGQVFWMSDNGFFSYNGVVNKLDCTVYDNIFSQNEGDGYNVGQANKTFSGANSQFSEVWWFYPDRDNDENNRYVIYNYADNIWYDGVQTRTTWVDQGTFQYPIATGASTTTYYQENGVNAGASTAINTHLETGIWDIDDGTDFQMISQFIPDFRTVIPTLRMQMAFYKYPEDNNPTIKGPFDLTGSNSNNLYLRGRGRHASITYKSRGLNNTWVLGRNRLRIRDDGQR